MEGAESAALLRPPLEGWCQPRERVMPEHETGDASGRAGLGGLFSTWPRKMLAVVLTATLGWVVSQTLPAAWRETSERAGLAPSAIHVDVITDPDVIQTLDGLQNPEFIVD